jgi:ankyrin repeat protein
MDELTLKLGQAIWDGNVEEADMVLTASPSTINDLVKELGQPIIEFAVDRGHSAIVDLLLQNGGNPNEFVEKPSPLSRAIHKMDDDMVSALLKYGADPDIGRPLISCLTSGLSQENCIRYIQLLIDHGADLNRTYQLFDDPNSLFTVLDSAKDSKVFEFLRGHGAKHTTELSGSK